MSAATLSNRQQLVKVVVGGALGLALLVGCPAVGLTQDLMLHAVASSVVIYENPNFGGRSQTLGVGEHRLSDFNDIASSIRVPAGLDALLFEHVDEGGGYGISVDLLEDHPDLSQLNFNKKLSYVRVFSSTSTADQGPEVHDHRRPPVDPPPSPQILIWSRNSKQNGQFVPGHWERQRAHGTPVNTIAVVSEPLPPHINANAITTILVNDAQSTISSLGQQAQSDAITWESANQNLMGVIGSDFRGVQEIGSAAFERKSGNFAIPDALNFWYPQKQLNDHRSIVYFKRTLSGTLDPAPHNPHTANINGTYEDHDLNLDIIPSAPHQYLITEGHPPQESDYQNLELTAENIRFTNPTGEHPNPCNHPFTVLEAEVTTRLSAQTKIDSLVQTRIGKQIAVYGPWIYDRGHCYQPEIHPAEQIWWSTVQGDNKYFNLNLFCDASGRFWWRDQMDDGSKLKPWGAPPITGTFAIAFEVQTGNPTKQFEVTNLGDYNVAVIPNSDKPHNLVYQNSTLVSFVPKNDAFKVSYEKVGLKAGTTNIVRGFLVIEATVGSVTQIATQAQVISPPHAGFPTIINFSPGTDPNKIDQRYERQVFKKVEGHYMFLIREH